MGLSPTTYGSAYGNFPNLLFNLLLVIDLFMASSAGSVASSANKQRGGLQLLANITNTSASAKGYALPWQKGRSRSYAPINVLPHSPPPALLWGWDLTDKQCPTPRGFDISAHGPFFFNMRFGSRDTRVRNRNYCAGELKWQLTR